MNCEQINELLLDYLYQELSAAQAEEVEVHLHSCPRCAEELSAFQTTRATMKQLPEFDPPLRMHQLLKQAAQEHVVSSAKRSFGDFLRQYLRPILIHPAASAAVILMVVLGISFYAYQQYTPSLKSKRFEYIVTSQPTSSARQAEGRGSPPQSPPQAVSNQEEETTSRLTARPRKAESESRLKSKAFRRVAKSSSLASSSSSMRQDKETQVAMGSGSAREQVGIRPESSYRLSGIAKRARGVSSTAESDSLNETKVALAEPQKDALDDLAERAAEKSRSNRDESSLPQQPSAKPLSSVAAVERPLAKAKVVPSPTATDSESKKVEVAKRDERYSAPARRMTSAPAAPPSAVRSSTNRAKGEQPSRKGGGGSQQGASTGDGWDWLAKGDKASAQGRCTEAFSAYQRAIKIQPGVRREVAARIKSCAAVLARGGEKAQRDAQKKYPELAAFLTPAQKPASSAKPASSTTDTRSKSVPR